MVMEVVAYHEVGHALSAWNNGIPFRKDAPTIVSGDGYEGRLQIMLRGCHWDVDKSDRARVKMERFVQVCLAGPAAQRRFKPSSFRQKNGSEDYRMATNAINYFVSSKEESDAYLKLLEIRTQQLFERPEKWAQVEALAVALLERKTLSADETAEIIQTAFARFVEGRLKTEPHDD